MMSVYIFMWVVPYGTGYYIESIFTGCFLRRIIYDMEDNILSNFKK